MFANEIYLVRLFLHSSYSSEQLGAKAVMMCFGAAVAQAKRHGQSNFENLSDQPIITRAVQLVNGRLDLVVFQLNTLDLGTDSRYKNIVWIEPGKIFNSR